MEDACIDHILSIPWAKALIEDPKWKRAITPSRLPKSTGEDEFFARTLATDRTLRAFQTLVPSEEVHGKLVYNEVAAIITLGTGLDGYPRVCHGGMAATLLDEICGILVMLSNQRQVEQWKQAGASDQAPEARFMTACKSCGTIRHSRRTDINRPQPDLQATHTRAWNDPMHCQSDTPRRPETLHALDT